MLTRSKMWTQLNLDATIEAATHEFIQPQAFTHVSLTLTPRHGFDGSMDQENQRAGSLEAQPPAGVPQVILDRVEFAMKLSIQQIADRTQIMQEEMLDGYPYGKWQQGEVTDASDSLFRYLGYGSGDSTPSYSAYFSQSSGLSSQSFMNTPSLTSEVSIESPERGGICCADFKFEDLLKILDAPIRRLLFGHKVSGWDGIVEEQYSDYPGLFQLSPSVFCPGYQDVNSLKISQEGTEIH